MQTSLETLSGLERRLSFSVPAADIDSEVETRLRRMAKTVKMHGFRPGKVPFKVVAQQYGPQVRQEVLGDTLQKSFGDAIRENNLRVAGMPRFEGKPASADIGSLEYTATFEVYPEIQLGEFADAAIVKPTLKPGDAEVDKTIDILRRQRVRYEPAQRPAQSEDLLTIDFRGTIDGTPFAGGEASDQRMVLGAGRLLPEFEAALAGASAGDKREFDVTFPADYHGTEVAGKTARFAVDVKAVAAPVLPEVDAEFAKSLGIQDGDIGRMREEILQNVEREVAARIAGRVKEQVMQALADRATLDLPQSLVEMEMNNLAAAARRDLEARGVKTKDLPIPVEALRAQAERRVRVGLILAELVRRNGLQAKPEQVLAAVEAHAKAFEQPAEVVKWYYSSPERLNEFESMALEQNVVEWVLGQAKVEEKAISFDELMGAASA